MRHFNVAPLCRSTVGFDRLFSLLDDSVNSDANSGYPRYNIEKTGEDAYRITLAVAGFADADLSIEAVENTLVVRGDKTVNSETAPVEVLFRGIAARAFERRFQLADSVAVTGAHLENGLLHIALKRELPEAKKPKLIPINGGAVQTIEATH